MHWGNFGMGGWGMGFGWIAMIIVWAVIILGIYYLVRLIAGGGKKEEPKESPLDVLKKRYAGGEISKEEFDRIKDDFTKQ